MRFTLLLALPVSLLAQSADLSGFVRDAQSAVVPKVTVEVRNEDTGAVSRTQTNDDGVYNLAALNPGKYDLTAQATGFKTLTRDGIVLQVQQRAQLDLTLEVGSVEEKVNVSANVPLVNTTDGSVSTVVDRQFVENLPLNGRSFQNLITLSPGVITTTTSEFADQGQFSAAGQRAGSNYFTIDGVSANFAASNGIFQGQTANGGLPAFSAVGSTASLVSIDALQEFRLETSTYAPEFGRESGAQAVLLTRSGSNSFHGTAFDYFRNDALDASDWFANSTGLAKPRERQNDFGGVLGGPVVKDKTFFFFSYEGLRVKEPFVAITDVPSLEARANAAPSIRAIANEFPLPNGPATGVDLAQLAASTAINANLDATSIRIDHAINSKVTLFGRFNHAPSNLILRAGGAPNGKSTVTQNIDTATVGSTALLSPTITNEFRFNYSRAHGRDVCSLDNFGGAVVAPDSRWFAAFQNPAVNWAYMGISGARSTNICTGPLADVLNHQVNVIDSAAIVKGTHQMKFGFDFRRLTPVPHLSTASAFYFWTDPTNPALSMADFINGQSPTETEIIQDPYSPHLLFHNFSAYAQDTWKASRRLTVTYGVRWDYNPPPTERTGHAPYVLSQITNLANATLLPPGTPLWHADWKNFAPRIGLSYLLRDSAERPTVLRLGAGQFYDLGTSTAGYLDDSENGWYPYDLPTVVCLNGTGPGCGGTVPYTGPKPPFVFTQPYALMRGFDPHLKLPYSLQWNVALEQAITINQTVKVTYVGSAGRRLLRDDLISHPNPILAGLLLTKNSGYSNYDALQIQYQQRLSHGLQALISYNWSHSLDTNSTDVVHQSLNAGIGIPVSLINPRQDYGNSNFDIRQTFSLALTYNIPTLRTQTSLVRAALRNWSLDSVTSARTGTPFNVLYTPATAGTFSGPGGGFQLRPDQVSGQPVYVDDPNSPAGKKLNPAAFVIPPELRQGSEGRNNLSGFSLFQFDLAVRRQFTVGEHVNLQLRVEGFNVVNHPNFGNPLNGIGACVIGAVCTPVFGWGTSQATLNQSLGANAGSYGTGFGSLYQVGGPRSFQLALKLSF